MHGELHIYTVEDVCWWSLLASDTSRATMKPKTTAAPSSTLDEASPIIMLI